MKKLLLILLIFSSFLLCGCENKKDDGKYLSIKLYCNPSAAESWEFDMDVQDIVDIEENYVDSCADEEIDGCGGNMVYKIIPKKEGTVTIVFTLVDISDDEMLSSAIYTITVDENLKITEEHFGDYFNE